MIEDRMHMEELTLFDKKKIKKTSTDIKNHISFVYFPVFLSFMRWILFALITGIITGSVGTAFNICIKWATQTREKYSFLIYFLPLAGVLISLIYKLLGMSRDSGTNRILAAVRESKRLTPKRIICIFAGSVITHLCGGSSGREGAALQIGGSIGGLIGRFLKLDKDDRRIIIMCGMSAGFSSVFGTPVAAAIFSIEVISVGILHYSAIVPCMISSLTGYYLAKSMKISYFNLHAAFPQLNPINFGKVILFGALCGIFSWLICFVFEKTADILQHTIKNPFIRSFSGGSIVVILTLICGTHIYNGVGTDFIYHSFDTSVVWYACLLKLVFTAITLGSGFKGGEIVPVFFIGAAFGSAISPLFGGDPSFFAALGMVSIFCGVTNCPVTSILIGAELFGDKGLLFYGTACAVSYMLSGYRGLYKEQRIAYSKLKTKYINKKTE